MYPLVTNIQKYSIHDGEGIRTTVFFKGCSLNCLWCHNPETQKFEKELLTDLEKCTGCGCCLKACEQRALHMKGGRSVTDRNRCTVCGNCEEYCLYNLRTISGREYSPLELVKELEKDRLFYEQSNGGVTLSGGEVLVQDPHFLEELLFQLQRRGIRTNLDTCGQSPFSAIEPLIPYVHTFLYDMKCMDPEKHKKYTGKDNTLILDNLIRLSGAKARIWIRVPVIGGVNDTKEDMQAIIAFLREQQIAAEQIHLLPYHSFGKGKYRKLQQTYLGEHFYTPRQEQLQLFGEMFESAGMHKIVIGGNEVGTRNE